MFCLTFTIMLRQKWGQKKDKDDSLLLFLDSSKFCPVIGTILSCSGVGKRLDLGQGGYVNNCAITFQGLIFLHIKFLHMFPFPKTKKEETDWEYLIKSKK